MAKIPSSLKYTRVIWRLVDNLILATYWRSQIFREHDTQATYWVRLKLDTIKNRDKKAGNDKQVMSSRD